MKQWTVYILQCADNTLYTGITTDMDRRHRQHNQGTGAKYTQTRTPCHTVYTEQQPSKSTALKRELTIKAFSRQQKLSLIRGLSEC